MKVVLRWIIGVVGATAILVTILPLIPSNEAWIRIWDFPRIQIAVLLSVAVVAAPVVFSLGRNGLAFMAVAVAALAWQLYGIWSYTTPPSDPGRSGAWVRSGITYPPSGGKRSYR